MARAEKAWRDALREQTIADLVAHYQRDVAAKQQQKSAQWIAGRMRGA
jgi:DNA-binding IscR family transcriptional regulator